MHTLPAEITPPRATTPPAAIITTSPPSLLPFVLQPTNDKNSFAESSNISNATPPRPCRARTRGGRVRQATGRKIRTRGSGGGHVWGDSTVGRRGGPVAG